VGGALTPSFYWLMTSLTGVALRCFCRWKVLDAERMPREGGLIVVANHRNVADPPLLGASLPRRLRFMAKQELFASKAGVFITLFGAIPVRRFEADLQALRGARRLVESGEVLGMFPEGHRSSDCRLIPAHPGTGLLALQTGVPILPVAIRGTEQIKGWKTLLRRPQITVQVGEAFTIPRPERISAEAARHATEQIMHRIAELLPAQERGVYTYDEVH
jgi:1-acyl-sn-glycerol-3-phosphate acyltransferase